MFGKKDKKKSEPDAAAPPEKSFPEPDTNPGKKIITVPAGVSPAIECTCALANVNCFMPASAHAPGCPVRG